MNATKKTKVICTYVIWDKKGYLFTCVLTRKEAKKTANKIKGSFNLSIPGLLNSQLCAAIQLDCLIRSPKTNPNLRTN